MLARGGVRGVGLDAHEGGEGVDDARDVAGVGGVRLLRVNEGGDAPGGGVVGASERQGLEEGGEAVGVGSVGEAPVQVGRGHVDRGEGEDVEEPLLPPAREELGRDVGEGGGGRAEAQDGVGDVELVLRRVRGEVGREVIGGEVAVEARELARELEGELAACVVREGVEVTVSRRGALKTEQGHGGLVRGVRVERRGRGGEGAEPAVGGGGGGCGDGSAAVAEEGEGAAERGEGVYVGEQSVGVADEELG